MPNNITSFTSLSVLSQLPLISLAWSQCLTFQKPLKKVYYPNILKLEIDPSFKAWFTLATVTEAEMEKEARNSLQTL